MVVMVLGGIFFVSVTYCVSSSVAVVVWYMVLYTVLPRDQMMSAKWQ